MSGKRLLAVYTTIVHSLVVIAVGAGAAASGAPLGLSLGIIGFFALAAYCAAVHAAPRWLGAVADRLQVRPGTVPAVLAKVASSMHWAFAAGSVYALFMVDVPSPDGLFYLLYPFWLIAAVGGAYFTWIYEFRPVAAGHQRRAPGLADDTGRKK